jgi:hypothetical protein
LTYGAFPNAFDTQGFNALFRALKSTDGYNLNLITILVEGGCKLVCSRPNNWGGDNDRIIQESALIYSIRSYFRKENSFNISIVKYLLNQYQASETFEDGPNCNIIYYLCENYIKVNSMIIMLDILSFVL